MKNSPNKSQASTEKKSFQRIRNNILLVFAGVALGVLCAKSCDNDDLKKDATGNKSVSTDASADNEAEDTDISCDSRENDIEELKKRIFALQSRLQLDSLNFKDKCEAVIIDEKDDKAEAKAAEIAAKLGIVNPDDIWKIEEAMLRGCTRVAAVDGDFLMLQPENICDEGVDLTEEPKNNWVSDEMYESATDKEKELVDAYRDKNYEKIIKDVDFGDVTDIINKAAEEYPDISELGIDKKYHEFVDSVNDTSDKILATEDMAERQQIVCDMIKRWIDEDDPTDEQQAKIHELEKNGLDLSGIDDTMNFYLFMKAVKELSGIDLEDPDECLE